MPDDSELLYVLKGSGLFTRCDAEASFDAVGLAGGVAPNAASSIMTHVEAKCKECDLTPVVWQIVFSTNVDYQC
jgi:hypothetical protein